MKKNILFKPLMFSFRTIICWPKKGEKRVKLQ